mmetsp:Transcript_3350/g.8533  ORF Transcript_3350/g.8533 Transcript_3350/m.8533 type:complete len:117 (+) Transcript_3350:507-857(+)
MHHHFPLHHQQCQAQAQVHSSQLYHYLGTCSKMLFPIGRSSASVHHVQRQCASLTSGDSHVYSPNVKSSCPLRSIVVGQNSSRELLSGRKMLDGGNVDWISVGCMSVNSPPLSLRR